MTNEECIQELKEELKEVNTWVAIYANDKKVCIPKEKRKKALDMAIKALEQEPCEDAISREEAINEMSNALKRVFVEHRDIAEKAMNKLPPVTPQPKIGHWIEEEVFDGEVAYKCSECGGLFELENGTPKDNEYNFCPKCGARMVESEDKKGDN